MMSRKLDASLVKKGGKKIAKARTGKAFVASQSVLESGSRSKRDVITLYGGNIGDILYDAHNKSLRDSVVVQYSVYKTSSNPECELFGSIKGGSGFGITTVGKLKQMYKQRNRRDFDAKRFINNVLRTPVEKPVGPLELGWIPAA